MRRNESAHAGRTRASPRSWTSVHPSDHTHPSTPAPRARSWISVRIPPTTHVGYVAIHNRQDS